MHEPHVSGPNIREVVSPASATDESQKKLGKKLYKILVLRHS